MLQYKLRDFVHVLLAMSFSAASLIKSYQAYWPLKMYLYYNTLSLCMFVCMLANSSETVRPIYIFGEKIDISHISPPHGYRYVYG